MLASPRETQFLLDDICEDMIERLAFLRHEPRKALVVGDYGGALAAHLAAAGATVWQADIVGLSDHLTLDLAAPYPESGFDFIAICGLLDTVNDLPGALIHIRQALAPGGLAIASFPGAGSLPLLRAAMLAAEPERPAARMHPLIDSRAGAQLLQRAGWKDPVVDLRELDVAYRELDRLISDLRAQGLSNVLANHAPALAAQARDRARDAFLSGADDHGRVVETFAILTLSGRRSLAGT